MNTTIQSNFQKETLADKILHLKDRLPAVFNIKDIYELLPKEKETTIRGRVYDGLLKNGLIKKVRTGVYTFDGINGEEGVILQGDARKLSVLEDESVDLIIADHPYPVVQGTNRSCNHSYRDTTFEYALEDFLNKSRVLSDGGFLIEFLPELKETNQEYLFKVVNLAKEAGFRLYSKVTWYKARIENGAIVDGSAFVGRKAVTEDVYIFTKGLPRKLRTRNQGGKIQVERGAKEMLPAIFMDSPVTNKSKIHQAQKPESLIKKLIGLFSNEFEVVLDQFSGSFVTFWSALELKRKALAIEINPEFIENSIKSKTSSGGKSDD